MSIIVEQFTAKLRSHDYILKYTNNFFVNLLMHASLINTQLA